MRRCATRTRANCCAIVCCRLLIEADPVNFAKLQGSGRRATMVHSAICSHSGNVTLHAAGGAMSGEISTMSIRQRDRLPTVVNESSSVRKKVRSVMVPCRPLSSLMAEAGITYAHFLSLDVVCGICATPQRVVCGASTVVTGHALLRPILSVRTCGHAQEGAESKVLATIPNGSLSFALVEIEGHSSASRVLIHRQACARQKSGSGRCVHTVHQDGKRQSIRRMPSTY